MEAYSLAPGLALAHSDSAANMDVLVGGGGQVHGYVLLVFLQVVGSSLGG